MRPPQKGYSNKLSYSRATVDKLRVVQRIQNELCYKELLQTSSILLVPVTNLFLSNMLQFISYASSELQSHNYWN